MANEVQLINIVQELLVNDYKLSINNRFLSNGD